MTLIQVSHDDLVALRQRLRQTRWPVRWDAAGWQAGTDADEMRRLVDYWATGYDWRAQEAAINALPSHFAEIAGARLHYLRFAGERPGGLPLLLVNGWPSSFLELTGLATRLAAAGHTVIVPSLPGFGFSEQQPTLLTSPPVHEVLHQLMHDVLGFERYGAHGGDLGAGITSRLAEAHPAAVAGLHLMATADPIAYDPAGVTDEERAYLDQVEQWVRDEGGYEHEQQTRPITLSYGLADSPAGLLAWILEKYRVWTDPGSRFDDDFILTQASLYWFTNTISTSFRPYYEHGRSLARPVRRVEVPTAVALFPHDLVHPPRSWVERVYHVTRYTRMARGGHFAAYEETALLADDLTAFFGELR